MNAATPPGVRGRSAICAATMRLHAHAHTMLLHGVRGIAAAATVVHAVRKSFSAHGNADECQANQKTVHLPCPWRVCAPPSLLSLSVLSVGRQSSPTSRNRARILVTLPVSHVERSELKAVALRNTARSNVHAVDTKTTTSPPKKQKEV